MSHFIVVVSCLLLAVLCSAQQPAPLGNPLAEAKALQFSNNVLGVVASRVLTGTYTPEQQEAALQVLEDAQTSLAACQVGLGASYLVWQNKLCSVTVLRTALGQLKAMEAAATATTATEA